MPLARGVMFHSALPLTQLWAVLQSYLQAIAVKVHLKENDKVCSLYLPPNDPVTLPADPVTLITTVWFTIS